MCNISEMCISFRHLIGLIAKDRLDGRFIAQSAFFRGLDGRLGEEEVRKSIPGRVRASLFFHDLGRTVRRGED